jgi:NAD+ kinase
MLFGLIANLKRQGADKAVWDFVKWAHDHGHETILGEDLRDQFDHNLKFAPNEKVAEDADIVVSMGGDGTLLATARMVVTRGKPVLGINLGSLGFLTQLTPSQLVPALDAIVEGKYHIEKRMLLKVEVPGSSELESPYALNDCVIDNGPVSRLIDIYLSVNGENVVSYRADGLVIATPTGSTAYSLAVGGPIVHPKMEAIITSPISSFSLSTRPMIISSAETLEIKIHSQHGQAGLTLDGQIMVALGNKDRVIIKKAEQYLKLIVFPENSYYELLKSKLHWGRSPLDSADPD